MTRRVDWLLRTLAHCGVMTVTQAGALAPETISARWLSAWSRESGLCTLYAACLSGRDIRYARLSKAGARYVREHFGSIPYRSSSMQLLHDLTLAGYYLRLTDDERRTWKTPDQILARRLGGSSSAAGSLPDGVSEADGRTIVVEIVGPTLTQQQIEKKRLLAWGLWNVHEIRTVEVGAYAAADLGL
jgi:hypothetical protein